MTSGSTQRRVRSKVLATASAAALALGGCAHAGVTGADGTHPGKATGSTITLGMISAGKGAFVDQSAEITGAQAAVGYVNNQLGGLNGHPISLEVCVTKDTPELAIDCANQMVRDNVSGVIFGIIAEQDQVIPILSGQRIPSFFAIVGSKLSLATPDVFSFLNTIGTYSTPAVYAAQQGFQRTTLLVLGDPGLVAPSQQIGGLLFARAKVGLRVVPIAPGAPDMTAQVRAAEAGGTQMYTVIGDPKFCTSAIQALRAAGTKAPIIAADLCIDPTASGSIPGGFQGVKVVAYLLLSPADKDFVTFQGVMKTYGDGAPPSPLAGLGYSATVALARAATAAQLSDTSPQSLAAAVRGAPELPYPLDGGATFQCNGKAIDTSENICSSAGLLADARADGSLTNYQLIDPGRLLLPGG
jgi:branched-chain amino acid transport system substrate-binding protein